MQCYSITSLIQGPPEGGSQLPAPMLRNGNASREGRLMWCRTIAAGLLLALATGAQARSLKTVASFTILADVVRQVGGSHVAVRSLVPPNGDPHEFEPSPDDARALKDADLAFVSGVGLEPWFGRLAKARRLSGRAGLGLERASRCSRMTEGGKTSPTRMSGTIRTMSSAGRRPSKPRLPPPIRRTRPISRPMRRGSRKGSDRRMPTRARASARSRRRSARSSPATIPSPISARPMA